MKRFIAVLSGLLVLPAFAEVAPIYYDEVIEYSDEEIAPVEDVADEDKTTAKINPIVQPSKVNPRGASRSASRVVPSVSGSGNVSARGATTRTASASRATTSATQARTGVASRTGATTRGVASRASTTTTASRNVRSATGNTAQATTRRATTSAPTTARASIVQTDTVNTPLYTGRVSTRSSAMRARIPTVSTAGATTSTITTDTTTATTDLDELAQVTDFCKAQYMQCMDNFCNVLDDNQGRCSCSKNLKNYEKTELALKKATEELQDVAQQIQYIGLTGDQIETLFTQTEAEETMSSTSDNTQLKNDLDRIKNLIVDVKPGTATSTATSGMAFDLSGLLDFSIDSTGFDLTSLFGGTTSNTSSISNQRGEQLFKTATARCKVAVLNDCQAQGVDISLITNSYDLEIDKQCIAYERSLTETNEEMTQTVRNAKSVLQRARLMVAQQKNAYDLRGCINALDACMQDDFVCGSDYENCLDPTGKYIVNGEIVLGSTPGKPGGTYQDNQATANTLYTTWDYEFGDKKTKANAWTDNGTVADYVDAYLPSNATYPTTGLDKMANYLHNKIGYISDGKAVGMCASILNQCQDYTYTGTGKTKTYTASNDVVKNYLERTLIQIKSKQDILLSDYAENCINDVNSCLSQNKYNYNIEATEGSLNKVAVQACMSEILTCRSVTASDANVEQSVYVWLKDALNMSSPLESSCINSGGEWTETTTSDGETTEKCVCPSMYEAVNNVCQLKQCASDKYLNASGKCVDIPEYDNKDLIISFCSAKTKGGAVACEQAKTNCVALPGTDGAAAQGVTSCVWNTTEKKCEASLAGAFCNY